MTEQVLAPLTQRLDRLERENRRLKTFCLVTLIVVAAVMLMGQSGPPIVEAQRFLIRDPATGKARATLSADAGGNIGLVLLDHHQKPRAELVAGVDGSPTLAFYDGAGRVIWKTP